MQVRTRVDMLQTQPHFCTWSSGFRQILSLLSWSFLQPVATSIFAPLCHHTINYKTVSATRRKAGCKSVKATASRALIEHFDLQLQAILWKLKRDLRGP